MPPAKPRPTLADRATPAPARGLATPLQYVKGVGPQRAKLLGRLGLHTVEDALFHLPARHEDRSQLIPFRSITPGEARTVPMHHDKISPAAAGASRRTTAW